MRLRDVKAPACGMRLHMPFSIANYEVETLAPVHRVLDAEWSDFEQAGHGTAADTLVLRTLMAKCIMSKVQVGKIDPEGSQHAIARLRDSAANTRAGRYIRYAILKSSRTICE